MARLIRWIPIVALVGVLPVTGRAQSPAVRFHGVGDLTGGPAFSVIRDATRVGGVIYGVGGSAAVSQVLCASPGNPIGCVGAIGPDTAVLWDSATGQLTALPNLVANATANAPILAADITPDGAYIASQARSTPAGGNRLAVRVERALVPGAAANVNLNVAPFPAYTQPTAALAISADGAVLAGQFGGSPHVARFDVGNAAGSVTVPLLRGTDTNNQTVPRGISANGAVIVGTSFAMPYAGTLGGQAFRYVFNSATNTGSIAGIPFLPGGTWNKPAAIAPGGQLTLVVGDSTDYPNGEAAIHNAATNAVVQIGSPNTPWTPSGLAGMTGDGSVVVMSFSAPNGYHDGYFHNQHGWFRLESAFASNGIDIAAQGWRQLFIAGVSPDGTLVYGQGLHNNDTEGFVAEFPSGYLAGFDVPLLAPADTAIVGTWLLQSSSGSVEGAVAFMADGTYYLIQPATEDVTAAPGFERGRYAWNAATGAFRVTTLQDTNGDIGASSANGQLGLTASLAGNTLTIVDPLDDPGADPITLTRLDRIVGTPIGGWVMGDPSVPDVSMVFVGLADGTYYMAWDNDSADEPLGADGIEAGTFTYNTATGEISGTPAIDTNGVLGFSDAAGPIVLHNSADDLTASGTDDTGAPIFLRRVIDPATVVPAFTSAGSAAGTVGVPFSFAVSATYNASGFTAVGLPTGLSIDGGTGAISGTPTVPGIFAVALTAANSLATGVGALSITVAPAPPDNHAPVCTAAHPSPSSIWPANHRWVSVSILGISDEDGDPVTTTIDSILQDEPTDSKGDGNTAIDGKGIGTTTAFVRAERAGDDDDDDRHRDRDRNNGRVYHIRFTASDGRASCTGDVVVGVPRDRHGRAVDDGARYDSTKATPPAGHHRGDGCRDGNHEKGRRGAPVARGGVSAGKITGSTASVV